MTMLYGRLPLGTTRLESRRVLVVLGVALGVLLLVAPVVVQLVQGRQLQARLEGYADARTSLSRVMASVAVMRDAAATRAVSPGRLEAAAAEVEASLAALDAAVVVAGLDGRAPADFIEATRSEARSIDAASRSGGGSGVELTAVDRTARAARAVSQGIAAAESAWVAADHARGLAAVVLQALASLALLAVLAREIVRRHRAHEAQTRRIAHIAESVADAVVVRDTEGRVTDWNDRASALYGYTREEALGRANFPEEAAGEARPFRDVMADLVAGDEVVSRRLARRRKDGSVVYVDVSAFLVRDQAGRPAGVYSLHVDVTAAVRASEALHRSEAYLRSVLDSSAIGIGAAVVDSSGAVAFANAEFERLAPEALGLHGTVIGAHVDEAVGVKDGADEPPWLAIVRAGLGGTASGTEFPVGLQRWMRVDGAPVWDEVGQHPGMTLIVRDVTSAHVDQERAREAEGRAAAIFHAAPVGLLVLDDEGCIEEVNAAVTEITGYPASALVGQRADVLADVSVQEHRLLVTRALELIKQSATGHSQATPPERYDLRRRDGRTFPASLQMGVLNVVGRASGLPELKFLCAIADVSPQVSAEREARRLERTQALNTLVGGVAHDFNNLLTVISGGIDIARSGQGEAAEWLERSSTAATQAAGLVRQLLRYSRPETDALEPVRLDEAVRETVSLVRATFDRRLAIEFDPPIAEVTVQGNRSQIDQVVMNLLVNARDAVLARLEAETAAGGDGGYVPTLTVAIKQDVADLARVVLVVRDNGVGIPAPVIDQVFDPFFTTKGPDRGTGLGLATVYSIVRAHGGVVTVESEVGRGTEFSVVLPLPSSRPISAAASEAGAGSVASRGRVLVVDDEEPVARIAQRSLTAAGMDVVVALDGHAAVSQCHAQRFDAILLDLNMPRPDGAETLVRLRAAAPRTPVMIVSGRLGASEVAEAAGVDFLAKPYLHGDLVARVAALIEAGVAG